MKIVDQNWGCEEYRKECGAFAKVCAENGDAAMYWDLYKSVMEDGANNTHQRVFGRDNSLPDFVKDGLLKVCRFMEYSQNIPILNEN